VDSNRRSPASIADNAYTRPDLAGHNERVNCRPLNTLGFAFFPPSGALHGAVRTLRGFDLPHRALPKEAGWRAEYLHELTVFPGGKYDDQVDSTAQLLDWLKGAGLEPGGIYQYYKELAQAPQTARPEPLSVMAKRLGLLRW
jgi:hypothetical protein